MENLVRLVRFLTIAASLTAAISATPAASNEARAGSATLRVLSLNIYGIPFPWNDRTRWDDMGRLLRERREAGLGPDVVAVQEAFIGDADRLMRAAGFKYHVRGPGAKGAKLGAGLQILSDLPLEGRKITTYTRCMGWDCGVRKGAVGVQIRIGNAPQPIHFFNTHANADANTNPGQDPDLTRDVRFTQIQELREFVTESKPSEAPFIAVGDFNMSSEGDDYASWVAFTMSTDAVEYCGRKGKSCSGVGDAADTWRKLIDHQFYLPGVSPSVRIQPIHYERIFTEPLNGRQLTDHPGLLVHYNISW